MLHLTHRCLTVSWFLLSLAFCVSNNNKKESLEKKFYLWYRTVSLTFLSHWRTYGTGWSLGNSTWQLKTTPSPSMAVMCTASSAKERDRESNSVWLVQNRETNKTIAGSITKAIVSWTTRSLIHSVNGQIEGFRWVYPLIESCLKSSADLHLFPISLALKISASTAPIIRPILKPQPALFLGGAPVFTWHRHDLLSFSDICPCLATHHAYIHTIVAPGRCRRVQFLLFVAEVYQGCNGLPLTLTLLLRFFARRIVTGTGMAACGLLLNGFVDSHIGHMSSASRTRPLTDVSKLIEMHFLVYWRDSA